MALFLQPVCLSSPTCLSLPKLSEAARANLSGRWGAGFQRVALATQSAAHNAARLNLSMPEWRIDATPFTAQIL